MSRALLLAQWASVVLVLSGVAAADTPSRARRDSVAPYLAALEARSVGEIDGRAYGQPTRASGDAVPLEGVSVMLLPYAAEVEAQLDSIKTHLRDSLANYAEAYANVTAVRVGYERELVAAGAGELVRGDVSDASGAIRLSGLPAGEWLLIAWREEAHAVRGARAAPKDLSRYQDIPVMTGYAAVSFWRMRVSVTPKEVTSVSLSDRSIWLTAVREERSHAGDLGTSTPKKRR